MALIDTHAHIYLDAFDRDRSRVVHDAAEKGVRSILLPNIDTSSIDPVNRAVQDYPGICHAMMGLHPTSVKEDYRGEFDTIREALVSGNYIAVGEIGIDLYWDKTRLREQSLVFEQELDLALNLGLPVVIHARESFAVIFEILEKYRGKSLRGVFHAFSGTPEQAFFAAEYGFMLGIGGMVTYKNAGVDKVVQALGLQYLVLETDAPYLTPVPFRGRLNEPAYLPVVAETIARLLSEDMHEVARVTTANAERLFGLDSDHLP